MPEKPARQKARIKPGYKRNGEKKTPPPPKTRDEILAKNVQKVEQRHDITPQKVNAMIAKERGLLTQVCRSLKIPRSTLIRYIDKHEECIEALEHARDAMGDVAERKLFEAIEAGDVRCILYYLSTVHRQRGYGMRQEDAAEHNAAGRGPIFVETVNIVGVPSGTFLPKEIAQRDNMVVEN